jgi:hypothetical protein
MMMQYVLKKFKLSEVSVRFFVEPRMPQFAFHFLSQLKRTVHSCMLDHTLDATIVDFHVIEPKKYRLPPFYSNQNTTWMVLCTHYLHWLN